MEYRKLGNTSVEVSVICLGTMTYGEQNTAAEAAEQLDCALDHGVNFIDAAEMYPVPPREETQGRTEEYIGEHLAKRGGRDRIVLATKVSGPDMQPYLRDGPRLSPAHIRQALEGSLRRLRTDYIDLYQVHWPERKTNFFGDLGYRAYAPDAPDVVPLEDTLEELAKLVEAGKLRHIGVSNETPWGVMKYLELARRRGWPEVVSVQNPYSLLNRVYEIGLSEIAQREGPGLLAYSPLGFGVLSGKYLDGKRPPGARLTLFDYFTRYTSARGVEATRRYVETARAAGLSPAVMALAYVNSRDFVTSNIIGATTMEQLRENLSSAEVALDDATLAAIEKVHEELPNPSP